MTKTSCAYWSKLNQSISRRRVLELGLALSATIAIFQFRRLSDNGKTVLICLNEFNKVAGAKFDDLVYVANYSSGLTAKEVNNSVNELINFNLIKQKNRGNDKILLLNEASQFFV